MQQAQLSALPYRHNTQDESPDRHQMGLLNRLLREVPEHITDERMAFDKERERQGLRPGSIEQHEHAALLKQLLGGQGLAQATTGGRRGQLSHPGPVSPDRQFCAQAASTPSMSNAALPTTRISQQNYSDTQNSFCGSLPAMQYPEEHVSKFEQIQVVQLPHGRQDKRRLDSKTNKIRTY